MSGSQLVHCDFISELTISLTRQNQAKAFPAYHCRRYTRAERQLHSCRTVPQPWEAYRPRYSVNNHPASEAGVVQPQRSAIDQSFTFSKWKRNDCFQPTTRARTNMTMAYLNNTTSQPFSVHDNNSQAVLQPYGPLAILHSGHVFQDLRC